MTDEADQPERRNQARVASDKAEVAVSAAEVAVSAAETAVDDAHDAAARAVRERAVQHDTLTIVAQMVEAQTVNVDSLSESITTVVELQKAQDAKFAERPTKRRVHVELGAAVIVILVVLGIALGAITLFSRTLANCTTPHHKCYDNGVKAQATAIRTLNISTVDEGLANSECLIRFRVPVVYSETAFETCVHQRAAELINADLAAAGLSPATTTTTTRVP